MTPVLSRNYPVQYNAVMYVRDLGEFGLIERLAQHVAAATTGSKPHSPITPHLIVTIGDDTAAWNVGGVTELLTTDTLVQGVHFTLETSTWEDLGWKGLASNLSDIAAMGGTPAFAVVTLGLPDDTLVEDIDALYVGLLEAATTYGVAVIGGDIVSSPVFFTTIALTGTTHGSPLLRSAACPGDQIAVTGTLGGSAAGLALLRGEPAAKEGGWDTLLETHRRPRPRVKEGQILAQSGVLCAMDVSDGLLSDLAKICAASGSAARVDATHVPVHPEARRAFPQASLGMALNGGEDYELLFTAPPSVVAALKGRLESGFRVIGTILEGESGQVTVVDASGNPLEVPAGGWDHFRP